MRRTAKRVKVRLADVADIIIDLYQPVGVTTATEVVPDDVPADERAQCLLDIVATLAEGRRRLTTTKLLAALEARGCVYGEATVKRRLAAAVRAGQITNREDTEPPGYGLHQWR